MEDGTRAREANEMQRGAHPFNPGRPHPCLPVPLDEQRRLLTVARLALYELQAGQADQALIDLRAVVAVCQVLLAGDRFTEDARRAAQEAAQAIESAQAGTTPPAAAIGPATAAVDLFEQLLRQATLRRLHDAQDAAAAAMA